MTKLPPDTNERIAKWCGWTYHINEHLYGKPYYWLSPDGKQHKNVPNYDTDLNACTEFEQLVEQRGLWETFIEALWPFLYPRVTEHTMPFPGGREVLWKYATATAEQRCAAMREVIRIDELRAKDLPGKVGDHRQGQEVR